MTDNLSLKDWPAANSEYELSELYRNTDQSNCLVAVRVPLQYPQTSAYLQAVFTHNNNGRYFDCQAVMLEDSIIGKIETTVYENGIGELDFVLRKEYTGRHIGRQVLAMYIERLRTLRICRGLCAYVDLRNQAAGRILLANGFHGTRRFSADVSVPDGNTIRIETRQGMELQLVFEETV